MTRWAASKNQLNFVFAEIKVCLRKWKNEWMNELMIKCNADSKMIWTLENENEK